MNETKLKNIIALLGILFAEDSHLYEKLMNMSPDYLIEKWDRYIESSQDEHSWGLHPILRAEYFDKYFDKWQGLENQEIQPAPKIGSV